jgi:hypothetical protein
MDVILLHILLGVFLFFIINWIGAHSYSIGYMQISIFVKVEEAPALNFLIRVLTPIVYLIIVSAVLYYIGADRFVHNVFLVNIYYLAFRLLFNIATERGLLLNWYRQALYWFAIITLSYFLYDRIIKVKTNILPDFTTIANELWIIILVFLFQLTNTIRLSQTGTIKRKDNYLRMRYNYFKTQYGKIIKENTQNEILEAISYAILIYEDFNRPRIARSIENIKFKLTNKPHTLGVMQVHSTKIISDKQSVDLGTKKIHSTFQRIYEERKLKPTEFYGEWQVYNEIIADYNGGSSYLSEVSDLTRIILEKFYKETTDTLRLNRI